MLNLKKTAVAVLALGSSAVFAGTMGPVCAPGAVTVPCESCGWDFGGYALYLQPTGHEHQGYFFRTVGDVSYFDSDNFDNDWNWGFKLEGSYHFSTGNDININWYHFDERTTFNAPSFFFSPFGADPILADYRYRLEPEWDAVNFEFGQLVNFGEHKVIRFHGGAQWAHLERRHRWDAFNVVGEDFTFGRIEDREERYNGFGPRVGLDAAYHFGNGFAIYANGATALLVGQNRFRVNNFATAFYHRHDRDTVVPELEAKLGAKYTYACGNGDFTIDAGWLVVNYFHPFRTVHTTVAGGVPVFSTSQSTDFSLEGPYVGAKWVGTLA